LPLIGGAEIGSIQEMNKLGLEIPSFNAESVDECVGAIESLAREYDNRKIHAMEMRDLVIREFSWKRCAEGILDLLT